MYIGERNEGIESLDGYLRDFQIYNQALAPEKINAIASSHFSFNEPPAVTAFNESNGAGTTINCTTDNCPMSGLPGRNNQSVQFNGQQTLSINQDNGAYLDYLNDTNTPRFSLSLWVRPSTYNTWIVGDDMINQKMRIGITKDGNISYEQGRVFSSNTAIPNDTVQWPKTPLFSTQKIPLNMWSHVMVSTNGGNEYIYVNGQSTSRGLPALNAPMTTVSGYSVMSTIGRSWQTIAAPGSTNVSWPSEYSDSLRRWFTFNNTTTAISLGQTHPLNGATSATIGMWVYPNALATYGNEYLLASSGDYQFLVGSDGRLYFALDTSTNVPSWDWRDTGLIFSSDKWQYFSMVLDANEPDANKKLMFRIDQADGSNVQTKY